MIQKLPLELFELIARYLRWGHAKAVTRACGHNFNLEPWREFSMITPRHRRYRVRYLGLNETSLWLYRYLSLGLGVSPDPITTETIEMVLANEI
jgi:hypothetical protein